MTVSGQARNAPCFCGSGRKLKHCCARELTPVRTWSGTRPDHGDCRWRFYRPHTTAGRYAGELAEHLCSGERFWIARGTAAGTSWMIDDEPASLFHILDRLPGALYTWVAEQTMTALNDAAPAFKGDTHDSTDEDEGPILGEIHELMREVMSLAHAGDTFMMHLPASVRPIPPSGWTRLAA
ncbi:MAG: SEC-C domain-containing protein [Solirubrobacteraceae bacterium]